MWGIRATYADGPQLVCRLYHSRCHNRLVTGRVVGNPEVMAESRLGPD